MQFDFIIERGRFVKSEIILDRPGENIVKRQVVEIKLVRNGIIETDIVVVNGVSPNRAKAKGNRSAILPPDKIPNMSRQSSACFEEILFCENFKRDLAPLGDA